MPFPPTPSDTSMVFNMVIIPPTAASSKSRCMTLLCLRKARHLSRSCSNCLEMFCISDWCVVKTRSISFWYLFLDKYVWFFLAASSSAILNVKLSICFSAPFCACVKARWKSRSKRLHVVWCWSWVRLASSFDLFARCMWPCCCCNNCSCNISMVDCFAFKAWAKTPCLACSDVSKALVAAAWALLASSCSRLHRSFEIRTSVSKRMILSFNASFSLLFISKFNVCPSNVRCILFNFCSYWSLSVACVACISCLCNNCARLFFSVLIRSSCTVCCIAFFSSNNVWYFIFNCSKFFWSSCMCCHCCCHFSRSALDAASCSWHSAAVLLACFLLSCSCSSCARFTLRCSWINVCSMSNRVFFKTLTCTLCCVAFSTLRMCLSLATVNSCSNCTTVSCIVDEMLESSVNCSFNCKFLFFNAFICFFKAATRNSFSFVISSVIRSVMFVLNCFSSCCLCNVIFASCRWRNVAVVVFTANETACCNWKECSCSFLLDCLVQSATVKECWCFNSWISISWLRFNSLLNDLNFRTMLLIRSSSFNWCCCWFCCSFLYSVACFWALFNSIVVVLNWWVTLVNFNCVDFNCLWKKSILGEAEAVSFCSISKSCIRAIKSCLFRSWTRFCWWCCLVLCFSCSSSASNWSSAKDNSKRKASISLTWRLKAFDAGEEDFRGGAMFSNCVCALESASSVVSNSARRRWISCTCRWNDSVGNVVVFWLVCCCCCCCRSRSRCSSEAFRLAFSCARRCIIARLPSTRLCDRLLPFVVVLRGGACLFEGGECNTPSSFGVASKKLSKGSSRLERVERRRWCLTASLMMASWSFDMVKVQLLVHHLTTVWSVFHFDHRCIVHISVEKGVRVQKAWRTNDTWYR